MEVVELQEKISGLKNYISGLKEVISLAERVILNTEIQIKKICKHEHGFQYIVGTKSSRDPDDSAELFHCDHCGVCNVLFVVEPFGYYGEARQKEYKIVSLDCVGLFSGYSIDHNTKWKGK